ncbi:sugar phosphate isomerase/epimerase [Candidatus Micrarchaeota archaeon]|nr:sugar phosphate isomerase/epimerase [Candidatus Micrarchaeota archaeon]
MIYTSSSCIENCRDIESVLNAYEKLGIERVELGSAHRYHPNIKSLVKKYNFKYIIHNNFPPPKEDLILNLASPNDGIWQRSISQVKTAIDFAKLIKSKIVSIHAGFSEDPDINFRFSLNPQDNDSAMERFIKALKMLEEYSSKQHILLAVENNVVAGYNIRDGYTPLLMGTSPECEYVFNKVRSRYFGMLLDIAHLNVSAFNLKFDRDDFIERTRKFVKELHIHENNGVSDQHLGLSNGSWFEKTVRSFKDQKELYFTLESSSLKESEIIKNLKTLKKWLV